MGSPRQEHTKVAVIVSVPPEAVREAPRGMGLGERA